MKEIKDNTTKIRILIENTNLDILNNNTKGIE